MDCPHKSQKPKWPRHQSSRQRRRDSRLAHRPLPTTSNSPTFELDVYTKVNKDLTPANQKIVKDTIQELITKQKLPVTAQNLIITTPRTSCIYLKPKIHKPNNPGCRIVSVCSCPTELRSSYLDKVMTPIVKSLPSYIKDSNHALETFRNFNISGENKIIFTMDITSLHTVIPNNEGLQALKYFFNQRPIKKLSSETLLRLAEMVLTLNCYSFGDNYTFCCSFRENAQSFALKVRQ